MLAIEHIRTVDKSRIIQVLKALPKQKSEHAKRHYNNHLLTEKIGTIPKPHKINCRTGLLTHPKCRV